MRLLAELAIFSALIALAWEKSFHEQVGEVIPMLGKATPTPAPTRARAGVATVPRIAPTPQATLSSGAWMWDPNHKSPLDRPTPRGPGH